MRVLHLDTEETWRGGERQALLLALGLRDLGHQVRMVAPDSSAIAERSRAAGLEVDSLSFHGELDPAGVWRLTRLLRRTGPDLVHTHSAHAHLLAAMACRLSGVGSCVVSRRVDFPIGRLSARLKYRWGVARFIAITRAVARVVEAAGVPRQRIAVVPSGIDPGRLEAADRGSLRRELGLADDQLLVGTLSHLATHKGIVHLLRAWPRVLADRPTALLAVAGEGEEREHLEAEAAALGITGAVRFLGRREDVADCLAAYDCFVLPSVLEGMGSTLLDALALERPAVASRVGGIPEVVADGETGLLVPAESPAALAEAILTILGDADLAASLGAAGRRRVLAEFTAERMVERTLEVYRQVLPGVVDAG